jgi:triosephosphate isomerase
MKNLYIVANWKENKTTSDAIGWLREFSPLISSWQATSNKKIILCPSFTSASAVSEFIKSNNLPIDVGVQDVSKFPGGAHTGEVSAREAGEFAKYSIIGHSERRSQGESDEDVKMKVEMALSNNIEPIVCVLSENVPVPSGTKIIAYEPIGAIGTGNPDTPENAQRIASAIKSKNSQVQSVLYGGSVTSENVRSFTQMQDIDGILVGGASLNPQEFSKIVKQC